MLLQRTLDAPAHRHGARDRATFRRMSPHIARLAVAATLVLAGCSGGGGSSDPAPPQPPPLDPQFRISGASPFAPGCDQALPTGTLYVNSEVEPHVAINPSNPNHLVAAWQQDRCSNGSARGLRSAVSFDGGRTWTSSSATFSRCTGGNAANGGDYERASDPWVAIGPDGTAYQIAIAVSGVSQTAGSSGAVLVARSGDGGMTWEPPVTVIRDVGVPFNDKESMSADYTDARFAYAVWDRLEGPFGPTLFSRTTDSGRTWEPARVIHDPGPSRQTLNNQVVVLPDGTLVCAFTAFVLAGQNVVSTTLMAIRSTDKGVTWSPPITISGVLARGATDPESGAQIRDGATLGSIAAGRNGQIAVVWQDARFSGGQRDGIALSRSLDGGLTWTAPVQINRVPAVQAFLPAVHIRNDGTIGVSYFDFRSNNSEPSILTDYWLVQSTDGTTWRESRIAATFDYSTAPVARGLFLGDYMGLVSSGTTFVPVYALTTGDLMNRTDVFATLQSTVGASASAADAAFRSGPPTEPMVPAPELAKAFSDAAARVIERRREIGRADAPSR
jgi:hypothetical protein